MRFIVVSFLLASASGWACDLCSVYSAAKGRANRTGWSVSLAEQYSYYATLQEDGDRIADPADQRLDSSITQLAVGYQFNRRLSAQVSVPWIYRGFKRLHDDVVERGVERGLGDMTLLARWRLAEVIQSDLLVVADIFAGAKLPTGNPRRLKEEQAALVTARRIRPLHGGAHDLSGVHGHDLALGSGSVDAMVGTAGMANYRRWLVNWEVEGTLRTEGAHNYRYADHLLWSVAPGYFLAADHRRTVAVGLSVAGEVKGKDTGPDGESADDTGMVSVYLGPVLTVTWKDRATADVAVELPVWQDNTAVQLVPDARVRAGVTWRF